MPDILKKYYRKYDFESSDILFTMSRAVSYCVNKRTKRARKINVKSAFKEFNKIISQLKKMQPKCVICLGDIAHRCFLDKCLHSFCTCCVSRWAKEKTICPTCGENFVAVFHDVRSIRSYRIRKFTADRKTSCLLKSMKSINSFYEINESIKKIIKTYKLSVEGFCNDVVSIR